ncbi:MULTISPECIES: hypothetical protein [Streptomyces]|uniref:Uncharacterized protein n=1 Tax=Streptomyces solicathayae TaxID=3081768 RepID=A0ABZ0LN65_9ACTN|nr:hypothetical protein [Streptomyces sp. HUAS YS2]WOX20797.1 hypothetical protein R2D22_05070 [Streptomyces sp. HUAS YS2]
MTENEIKLKAIAALTALRAGDSESFVSDLLGEVIPDQFTVPAVPSAEEIGRSVLHQLSGPLSALISGFINAFEAVAQAYDETGAEPHTDGLLQELALRLADDDLG